MENLSSVIGFFYNIVPGLLFLFINDYNLHLIYTKDLSKLTELSSNPVGIFFLLALSLLIGFVFQSFTKIIRIAILDKCIFTKIKESDEKFYKFAKTNLSKIKRSKADDIKENFYLMHNYISGNKKDRLPEYFSARFAFWSNIFFGFLLSLIIFSSSNQKQLFNLDRPIITIIFLIILVYSFIISWLNHLSLYDSVIKTFITQITIKSSNP